MCQIKINKAKSIIILIVFPIFVKSFSENENYIFEYNHPRNCKSNEYFDIDSFSCLECDSKKNLEPSENGKDACKLFLSLWFKLLNKNFV